MNSRFSWQRFKALLLVQSLFALLLAATDKASAAVGVDIKTTNYPIPGGAIFVSPNGSTNNSGKTASSPWPVSKALSSAPNGATIVFRGGTYRNVRASIKKKLTLQPYPGEKAWIKGSLVVTGWVADGGRWRKDGWIYSFPKDVGDQFLNPAFPQAALRDMVYINGEPLKQVTSKSQVGPGEFYVDPANKKLYIGSNPAGKTVESTASTFALTFWKTNKTAGPSDTTIRGLGFVHYADMALRLAAPRITLENNTIAWNGVTGAYFWGSMSGVEGISTDAVVRGNTFSYNGRSGLTGDRAHRMLMEDNTFSFNNRENYALNWAAAGVKFTRSDRLLWRGNRIDNNYSIGAWIDLSSTNSTVVKNVARENLAMGLFLECSKGAIMAGNLAYKNKYTGIMLSNMQNARVYNNTLVNNGGTNLVQKDTTRPNPNPKEVAAGITWIARGNVFRNNILSNSTGSALFITSNCATREPSSLTIAAADHNAYYRTASNKPSNLIIWSTGKSNCQKGYGSISAFQSETGYEQNTLVVQNVSTNPFFVNEKNNDYRLKSNSSAIGRGTPVPSDIADAIDVKAGVKVDLGAFQSKL